MTRKSVVSVIVISVPTTILLVGMFTYLTPVRIVVPGADEPKSLQDSIEYPNTVALTDLEGAVFLNAVIQVT